MTDKMKFIKAVAAGTLDPMWITIDEAELKRRAQRSKGAESWPGVEVFEDVVVGNRR